MRNLKQIKVFNKDNFRKIPKVKWELLDWYKNSFRYRHKNQLLTIHDYDYRDTFEAIMPEFFIGEDEKTCITLYKIGHGDPLFRGCKILEEAYD